MEDIKFSSLNELYNRLIPAMETKVKELKLNGINFITVDDIWNYLTLSDCVDDILNTSDEEYKKYMKTKMKDILGGVR